VFLHGDFLHLAFNLYWLWLFGSVLEDRLGSLRFLGVVALTGFVASGFEFAATGNTGVGLSGVGYGLFGSTWLRSRFDPVYQLRPDVVRLFVAWFFIAILIHVAGIMGIANWAHGGGFVAGATLAMTLRGRGARWKLGGVVGLLAAVCIAVAPLIGMPWNTAWLRHTALEHQKAGRDARALEYYDRVLVREPDDAWSTFNRGVAHQDLGHRHEARRDFERACELDSKFCR
jgi:GlpG protein